MNLILSTVGTSLLTNATTDAERKLLNSSSNLTELEASDELKQLVQSIKTKISHIINGNDVVLLKKASAELNGLISFYGGIIPETRDAHILIGTDTFLGRTTVAILEEFLRNRNITVSYFIPEGFSTKERKTFLKGVKDLLRWFDNPDGEFSQYEKQNIPVIFNLTGSFKSLQGYLNTLGMFYADKLIYIFETGNELIEIPRLPVKIDDSIFRKYSSEFALMAADLIFNKNQISDVPETMLEEMGQGKVVLSYWGELAWNKVKKEILSEKLLNLPMLDYSESFKKEFDSIADINEKIKLQETIARCSKLLIENNGNTGALKSDGGLLYEVYQNSSIGHFRINRAMRVSCIKKNESIYLRHYGTHDYIYGAEGMKKN